MRGSALGQRSGRAAALIVLVASAAGCADRPTAHAILFSKATNPLGEAEQEAAFEAFSEGFAISADGLRLEHPDCGDMTPEAQVVDLNGDDEHEIFISWGNVCTSGADGRSLTLLIGDGSRRYRRELGFPAATWTALEPGADGWPDLLIRGAGFCHPVWTYRGASYEFKCNMPESADACAFVGDICP